jgi:glutamine cyclotransferase
MKNWLIPIILTSLVFTTFQCCTSNPKRSRKPVSTISLSPDKQKYYLNEKVDVTVNTKIHDGELKNITLYLNNAELVSSSETSFTFTIDAISQLGQNTLRAVAVKSDDNTNTRVFNFDVLSNTPPEKLTYEIIAEHPHSTEHFTQGLEFTNGFLYEGTGEHGKSAIYKKDPSNGKILLSKPLADKYFGEGITIINDKIYQLTYKSQLGFSYNLSDFAVIDSFRFDSKEGWGLTNDGKELIMSNGTASLIWLNPEDYTVVRQIQVADNQRVWMYLNELEYSNGNIWANVWTTNQIIRIDAETGKVTGILDLEGILSIMHSSQVERIDVLNGIAIHPKTGHLFVTGKLWPKMFEIKVL